MLGPTRETIIQAAQGDLSAFKEIYQYASGFVYNVALRLLNTKEDAEEITQDVFIAVHHKLSTYRFESSLKTWLYRITFNLAINRLNKKNKERKRTVSYEDAVEQQGSEKYFKQDENRMLAVDQENLVQRLLNTLNQDQRACVILRNIEGLSYEEIARSLKININTVRSRLKRAREKLIALRNTEIKDEL